MKTLDFVGGALVNAPAVLCFIMLARSSLGSRGGNLEVGDVCWFMAGFLAYALDQAGMELPLPLWGSSSLEKVGSRLPYVMKRRFVEKLGMKILDSIGGAPINAPVVLWLAQASAFALQWHRWLLHGWQTSFMARTLFANPALDGKSQGSFWSSLAKRAKAALLEDDDASQRGMEYKHEPCEMQAGGKQPSETKAHTEHDHNQTVTTPTLQKGFHSFKSSLSALSGKIGNAIEGLAPVETKASDAICPDSPLVTIQKKVEGAKYIQQQGFKISYETITDYETQLKASRDVAMAMATKAKLLLRELKTIKADLAFAKNRCLQLEEENKRLRESLATGVRPVEEDLMRDQLETLLEEKCRLAQENAFYARENRFLREVVGYHQLTMQDVVLLDESITEAAELADESGFEDHDLDQLPEKVISIVST